MRIINISSGNSVWKGLDYVKDKKVVEHKKISEFEYNGKVLGSENEKYNVVLNIEHPRSSKCDCPHAKEKRIICKHIVALYFAVFPDEVDNFLKEQKEAEQEYETYEENLYKKTIKHINSIPKSELQDDFVQILNIAPEWVYEWYVRHKVGFKL